MQNQRSDTRRYAEAVLGVPCDGSKRSSKGMDDLDRWAEICGKADRSLRTMTPNRRFTASRT